MKNLLVSVFLVAAFPFDPPSNQAKAITQFPQSRNLFIITIDGFRWQELYNGADSLLINDSPDPSTLNALYWDPLPNERRKRLLPFTWNVIARNGQLYGNRQFGNNFDAANQYSLSYPGYNEIFTGNTDRSISTNRKYRNPNKNVLESLNQTKGLHGKVVAFTSWDVFPYILNQERNKLPINSGYNHSFLTSSLLNEVQETIIINKESTRKDELTFVAAKEYLQQFHPRILFLGLGETDEFAHDGRYDLYLHQVNKIDHMLAELWHWVQTTPAYKDNTTILITTDHGRGSRKNNWSKHGTWTTGSSQTWLALLGPELEPLGEVEEPQQHYLKQLATTIAGILGESFEPNHPTATAMNLPLKNQGLYPRPDTAPSLSLLAVDKLFPK